MCLPDFVVDGALCAHYIVRVAIHTYTHSYSSQVYFMSTQTSVIERAKTYQSVKRRICQHLVTHSPIDRLPPISTFAKQLGTGQRSTAQAIQDLVRDGILVSRPSMGTFVNGNIEQLKPKLQDLLRDSVVPAGTVANKNIRLLTGNPDGITGRFVTRARAAFMDAAQTTGLPVQWATWGSARRDALQDFADMDAMAIFNPHQDIRITCGDEQFITIIATHEPDIHIAERFDLISVDDLQGFLLIGNHLRDHGIDNVCFVGCFRPDTPDNYDLISTRRMTGLMQGLREQIPAGQQLRFPTHSQFHGAQAVARWIEMPNRPDTIVAASDDLAFGFIHGASAHGLYPGKDYHIIGFDCQQNEPDPNFGLLTSVAVPVEDMCTLAVRIMAERLQNPDSPPRRIYMGCTLVCGTTG